MTDNKYRTAIADQLSVIAGADDVFSKDEREILSAAVYVMAEAFPDLEYSELSHSAEPFKAFGIVENFMIGVKYVWAEFQKQTSESWTQCSIAMNCPFSEIRIDLLIRRFELLFGRLWTADKSKRTAEHEKWRGWLDAFNAREVADAPSQR